MHVKNLFPEDVLKKLLERILFVWIVTLSWPNDYCKRTKV